MQPTTWSTAVLSWGAPRHTQGAVDWLACMISCNKWLLLGCLRTQCPHTHLALPAVAVVQELEWCQRCIKPDTPLFWRTLETCSPVRPGCHARQPPVHT